jgi:hypothetical protein
VFAGLLVFGSSFLAQAQTIFTATPASVFTTGIVGVAGTQTARLNVLNLQPVIPGVTAVLCPATLEFYDDTGALLKQLVLTNIAPATAASLVFKPAVASTARAQIRAVVLTPQTSGVNPGASPPTPFISPARGCNVMSSLEIIDDLTGATHTLTTDLRAMPSFSLLPIPAPR